MAMIQAINIPEEQLEAEIAEYFQENPLPGGGGIGYVYDRNSVVAATWIIDHNLNKYPQVTLIDDDGFEIEADISYGSLNQVTVTFAEPQSGKAVLL
jgi:hypothetical protein